MKCTKCHAECLTCTAAGNDKCVTCPGGWAAPTAGTHLNKCVCPTATPAKPILQKGGGCVASGDITTFDANFNTNVNSVALMESAAYEATTAAHVTSVLDKIKAMIAGSTITTELLVN